MDMMVQNKATKQWFLPENEEFIIICENAGFDPNYIYEKTMRAMAKGARLRVALGKARDYENRRAYMRRYNAQYKAEKMSYSANIVLMNNKQLELVSNGI